MLQHVNYDEWFRAVGRLTTWGDEAFYSVVDIQLDGPTDMIAIYSNPSNEQAKFVLGAVWHGDHYGFHS